MNLISLTITSLVFGKLNAQVSRGFGNRFQTFILKFLQGGQLLHVEDVIIGRFCAVVTTIGFLVIGLARSYGIIILGELRSR